MQRQRALLASTPARPRRDSIATCRSSLTAPTPPSAISLASSPASSSCFPSTSSASAPTGSQRSRGGFTSVLGLVQWAVSNGIRFTGCRPDVREGVRGVFATADVDAGDNLVAVPLRSSLVVRPGERSPFPEFIPEDVWAGLPWYCQLACKLLHERSLGSASRFADYLPSLPRHVDLPALWPAAHVRRLQYPYLEQQILDEQDEWARMYDTLRCHLDRRGLSRPDLFWALACVRSRTFAGPHMPTPSALKLAAGAAAAAAVAALNEASFGGGGGADGEGALLAVTLPAALAALGVPAAWQAVEARRAQSAEAGTVLYAVCPFIDMFNHDSGAQSECVFAPWKDEFRIIASEPRRRGQEVFISYGNQSNDALLQRYGFVQLVGNPHDRYVVQDMRARLEQALVRQLAVTREVVRDAVGLLDLPPGSLDQVVLTPAGAAQQTVQAVAALTAAAVGARVAVAGLKSRPLPEALLAAACAEEAAAAETSLQEDEEALAQLGRWEAWHADAAARQAAAAAAAASASASLLAGEEGRGEEVGAHGGKDAEGLTVPPPPADASVSPPLELAAFDGDMDRYRTVLQFRVAKKRVLSPMLLRAPTSS